MTPEDYLGRVRATAWQAAEYLPRSRLEQVHRLIDHGEPAEGLRALAWAIVRESIKVPSSLIQAIREGTAELIEDESMPADLDQFAQE